MTTRGSWGQAQSWDPMRQAYVAPLWEAEEKSGTAIAGGVPERKDVPIEHTWDLSSLFSNDDAWEEAFTRWEKEIPKFSDFQGKLHEGTEVLAQLFALDSELSLQHERLAHYTLLRTSADSSDTQAQTMLGRGRIASIKCAELCAWIEPELLALPEQQLEEFLHADALAPYHLKLERLIRYKPHTLSPGEERLLALQGEMASVPSTTFRHLNDTDLDFGALQNEKGETVDLTHSSLASFLQSPDRDVRRAGFVQYYDEIKAHENTLAALLAGSVQGDVYRAKVRNHPSAREASLFSDNIPVSVYDSLIEAVHAKLPSVYRYFEIRRRKLDIPTIEHYDTYVPIIDQFRARHTWDEAVEKVIEAMAPLGTQYCDDLAEGLRGRWCDRYENRSKRSGAFSCGSYQGDPYILMNFQEDVLDHVFTLAHEAGHSMHTFYSARNQPFEYYDYTIFVAEVASTFNEQLLNQAMIEQAESEEERAYLISREIDAIRGTIVRQTMFAEFEKITHAIVEADEPLTRERMTDEYQKLLELYFGPDFTIHPSLKLECFRIPHFYSAFYVYKYATGLSAAIALSQRVLEGGATELQDYLSFLKAGCSKWPLEILQDAGVDMTTPGPVNAALTRFDDLVAELETLI